MICLEPHFSRLQVKASARMAPDARASHASCPSCRVLSGAQPERARSAMASSSSRTTGPCVYVLHHPAERTCYVHMLSAYKHNSDCWRAVAGRRCSRPRDGIHLVCSPSRILSPSSKSSSSVVSHTEMDSTEPPRSSQKPQRGVTYCHATPPREGGGWKNNHRGPGQS